MQVKVEQGLLEGEMLDNKYGKPYYSFRGIPYAKPPSGELRFKAPKPAEAWVGVRSAKQFGSLCYQRDYILKTPPAGSEDCLYLNVYSPNLNPNKPLPVMFWIHGGAYIWGSGNVEMYGPDFIINHNVILVTFNYRLGPLGFLCLHTEDVPGNAGMKDQVLALKWVNKNISKFGGDPNNITIFGESAGASSIGFHLLSPMSKGLFKRAVMQSGSFANFWASVWCPREKSVELARQLGLHSDDDKELYDFFKKQPVESFIDLSLHASLARKQYVSIHFGVVSEKDFDNEERFFYGDPFDWVSKGIHEDVEVLTGYTEHDGLLALSKLFVGSVEKLNSYANDYPDFFVPQRFTYEIPLIKQFELGDKMKKFYMKNQIASRDNFDALLKFVTLDMFAFDVILTAKLLAKKNKTYLYKFTCKSERNQMDDIFGVTPGLLKDKTAVCHVDDLAYLFPMEFMNQVDINSNTYKMIDNVTKLWTNFAKYGNPTPDDTFGANWIPFTTDDQNYLDIGNQIVAKAFPEKEDIAFWEQMYEEYLPRCVALLN